MRSSGLLAQRCHRSNLSLPFQGHAFGVPAGPGRRGLDKGTLAAAHIGLVRAGQRPPDRRTAYGPPPLVKPPAEKGGCVRAGVLEVRSPGATSGGTMNTRAAASTGK